MGPPHRLCGSAASGHVFPQSPLLPPTDKALPHARLPQGMNVIVHLSHSRTSYLRATNPEHRGGKAPSPASITWPTCISGTPQNPCQSPTNVRASQKASLQAVHKYLGVEPSRRPHSLHPLATGGLLGYSGNQRSDEGPRRRALIENTRILSVWEGPRLKCEHLTNERLLLPGAHSPGASSDKMRSLNRRVCSQQG